MKIFGEFKIPCEYMSDNVTQDWLHQRIANKITEEMLNQNLIKFTERYESGYYIMLGEFGTEAYWLINPDGYYPYCSNCKNEPKSGTMTKFCPECGAKMI